MSFFDELKRRNVFRVGVAYVIGGWLLLQLTDVLSELLDLPDVVGRIIVLVVAIGLPITLFFAWAFEMTPEGIKKEKDVDRSQSITTVTGQKLNNVIIGILVMALGYFVIDKFILAPGRAQPGSDHFSQQVPDQPAKGQEKSALTPIEAQPVISKQSIAVLPFDNRSNREEDQFFTDGIHDDLLTTIARIGSMKVISRTSVMEYKNTTKKLPEIAKELGVANILEGGIQRSGNQVRINVQLIDAKTDEHLWAEIFDRELTVNNLFAIQSEISKAIAEALQATLSPEEEKRIDTIPTTNLLAFEAYQRGRQLMSTRESAKLEQAAAEFKTAVEMDPDFALAWVGVADSHLLWWNYGTLDLDESLQIRDEAVKRAMALDRQLGEAHASQGKIYQSRRELGKAEASFKRAIELSPNYATAYFWYANMLAWYPLRAQERVDLHRKAIELDPRSAIIGSGLAGVYHDNGLYSRAEGQRLKVLEMDPDFAPALSGLALLYWEVNRWDQAIEYSRLASEQDPGNVYNFFVRALIYLQLGEFEKAEALRQQMEDIDPGGIVNGELDYWSNFVRGNDAASKEARNWLLPRPQENSRTIEQFAINEIAMGSPQRARELLLLANPGWLEPDAWPGLTDQSRNRGCFFAWILMQTGDQELGEQLLQYTTKYLLVDLPAAIEHADYYSPHVCHLVAGDIEKFYSTLEGQLDHKHLGYWRLSVDRYPMFEKVRFEPRMQELLLEHDRLIEEQRIAVAKLDEETTL